MKKPTVDVIIPVNNTLEWLVFCIDALMRNTDLDLLGTVYLVEDGSNAETQQYLDKITHKWHGFISVIHGKTASSALKLSSSDYVLLLNHKCILSENAIAKMLAAFGQDKQLGLLCPISSSASNYSYATPDGMNFMQVNEYLGKQFAGKTFDAPDISMNCLMLSREVLTKVGFPESANYQEKAAAKGFTAKVLIDTYVYYKAPSSPDDPESAPVQYIKEHVKYGKVKNACQLVVTDLVEFEKLAVLINNLLLDHINVEMVARHRIVKKYKGIMLFSPTIKRGISFK